MIMFGQLVASWNSGSSFLSHILNLELVAYFAYEPLHSWLNMHVARTGNKWGARAKKILDKFTQCIFGKLLATEEFAG